MLGSKAIDVDRARALTHTLGFVVDRIADYDSSFCIWHAQRELIRSHIPSPSRPDGMGLHRDQSFRRCFGELRRCCPLDRLAIEHCCAVSATPAEIDRGNAQVLPFPDGLFDAVNYDPPYYVSFSTGICLTSSTCG